MAKRERRQAARKFVDGLPIKPPLSKEAWGNMKLTEIFDNATAKKYFLKCEREITASGRAKQYVDLLAMIAHLGRFDEFGERSIANFKEEALNQHFTVSQLNRALEVILTHGSPGEIFANAASAFEFMSFAQSFVEMYAKQQGKGAVVRDAADKLRAMSVVAFAVAVRAEFGLEDGWAKKNGGD